MEIRPCHPSAVNSQWLCISHNKVQNPQHGLKFCHDQPLLTILPWCSSYHTLSSNPTYYSLITPRTLLTQALCSWNFLFLEFSSPTCLQLLHFLHESAQIITYENDFCVYPIKNSPPSRSLASFFCFNLLQNIFRYLTYMMYILYCPFSIHTSEHKQYENENSIALLIVLSTTFSVMLDALCMLNKCF